MPEIELNRLSHLIDPELHIWGWEIPVYLFLGGLTAGIMVLIPLLWKEVREHERSRWARLLPFAAPVIVSAGMLALFLDLSYKTHALRFYAAFRWTSPMSWGAWILVAIYPATLLFGLAGLNEEEKRSLVGFGPIAKLRMGGVIERAWRWARFHEQGVRVVNMALGVALGSYTGLLLSTLGARHVWNSAVLGPLFLASGISTGAAFLMLFPLAGKEHHLLRKLDMGAIGLELALIAVFLLGLVTGGSSGRAGVGLFLGGKYTATFWSLVVISGLFVPLIIELLEARKGLRPTLWAPVLLLVGGLAMRWILVSAGQA